MLFVQRLHERVDESAERRVGHLLDHLRPGFLGVVLRHHRAQPEQVHDVVGRELVGAAEHELELIDGHLDGLEQRGDDEAVVFGAELDQLDGRFEVVEEAMDVGEEDLDSAAGAQEMGDLEHGDEVAAMRPPGGCRACEISMSVTKWAAKLERGGLCWYPSR